MTIGIRKAYKLAGINAAGLIEAMDLAQLFGDDIVDGAMGSEDEAVLTEAQGRLVAFMTDKFSE